MHLTFFLANFVLTAIMTVPAYFQCVAKLERNGKTSASFVIFGWLPIYLSSFTSLAKNPDTETTIKISRKCF